MSSSITMKSNPFQRANPFQVQSSYQPSITPSLNSYQPKSSYRTYQPYQSTTTLVQKQNSYNKKPQTQLWKFHQDNCGKQKIFNHQTNSILNDRYNIQKNSFQKQLVLSNVIKKHNNNSGQQYAQQRQKMYNPFGRKYLMTNNALAQSQVYTPGYSQYTPQENAISYDKYKNQYDGYTPKVQYNNYVYSSTIPNQTYINQLTSAVASNNNLQTSLHYKYNTNDNEYVSRKSIQRDDSYGKVNGSYNNIRNPIQSRYSIERDRQNKYNSIGSNKDIYQSNKDIYPPIPSMKDNYSKASRVSGAQRDRPPSQKFSRVSQKNQRVNFQSSDDQKSPQRQSRSQRRQPTFGSRKDIPQLKGPSQITIKGSKFYLQKVECY